MGINGGAPERGASNLRHNCASVSVSQLSRGRSQLILQGVSYSSPHPVPIPGQTSTEGTGPSPFLPRLSFRSFSTSGRGAGAPILSAGRELTPFGGSGVALTRQDRLPVAHESSVLGAGRAVRDYG